MMNYFRKTLIFSVVALFAAVAVGVAPKAASKGKVASTRPAATQPGKIVKPGPRGPIGPDVPLSKAEKKLFANRIVVRGVTNAGVQLACDHVSKADKKSPLPVVFLPAGKYVFEKTVNVPAGITILGAGSKTCCRTKTSGVHLFKAGGDNVRFTRLKLQGADTTTDNTNNTYGIVVSGVKNIRIDHCELLGFSYATNFGSEAVAMLDHCKIHHNLRNGLGYGVALYSGAKVLVCDNEFWQNRHSLASNGALDWSSHKKAGRFLHKKGVDKTHWEFIHNRVGGNSLSNYELVAVDTHPGMDGTFVVENNIFENLRCAIGIRDGAGVIRRNLIRNPYGKSWRPWSGIAIQYGKHNGVPVENAMPHHIEVAENTFLNVPKKYKKYHLGKAENIIINGKLLGETRSDNKWDLTFAKMPRMEVGKDGKLRILKNQDRRISVLKKGKVTGKVLDEAGKPVSDAAVHLGTMSATTDAEGRFAFEEITEGERFLVVIKAKFDAAIAGFSITAGKSSDVVVRLKPDRTAPRIIDVRLIDVGSDSATIRWVTDDPSTGGAICSPNVQKIVQIRRLSEKLSKEHKVKFTSLRPCMSYQWQVIIRDECGNESKSESFVFRTGPTAAAAPPKHWGYYVGGGKGAWGRTTTGIYSGKFSAFMTVTTGTVNVGLMAGDSNGYVGEKAYTAKPSAKYKYSFQAKGNLKNIRLRLVAWKTDEAKSKDRIGDIIIRFSPTSHWKKYEGEFTMPAGAKKFALMFQRYGKITPDEQYGTLYIDDLSVSTGGVEIIKNGGVENK